MTVKKAISIIEQPKFMVLTKWISIISKWSILLIFVWKVGVYTERVNVKYQRVDVIDTVVSTLSRANHIHNMVEESIIYSLPPSEQRTFKQHYAIISDRNY